ncbi:MAG: DUF1080 domain-containing protein, partial [Acidobacteria bacterium]|nr:DUF1080 domain-containing protein [Acidobacteriota bacterium]
MRTALPIAVIVVLLFGAMVNAQQLTEQETKNGFESLFNGKDFTGWRFNSGKEDNWEVKDGLLVLKGGSDHLASEKDYGDFVLRFEWRAEKKGYDSGFFIRSGKSVGVNQVHMAEGGAGSLSGVSGAKAVPELQKPPGEWNVWEITCVGDRVKFVVNGKKAWEGTGLKPARGYFGIQAEGHHIDFRNFRIKEIKSPYCRRVSGENS